MKRISTNFSLNGTRLATGGPAAAPVFQPSSMRRHPLRRGGFTVMEIVLVLGLLTIALTMLAQLGMSDYVERTRHGLRQDVTEAAANILEAAQATSWDALTPEWAATQRLPDSLSQRLFKGQLQVKVAPEPGQPHVKRVSVEIGWRHDENIPARPVTLTTLLSSRAAPVTEKKS